MTATQAPSAVPVAVSYRFDENLREVPNDPAGMARAAMACEARLADESDSGERLRTLGLLGGHLRLLGRLEEAEARLDQATALARELGDEGALLTNGIRLAHVWQWQRRFAEADALFAAVVARCEDQADHQGLLAFALQHAGKSLFDQERYVEAEACFAQALAIRRRSGDTELIASSQFALDTTRARRAG